MDRLNRVCEKTLEGAGDSVHWDVFFEPLDEGAPPMPAWMDPFEVAMQRLMPLAQADGVAL